MSTPNMRAALLRVVDCEHRKVDAYAAHPSDKAANAVNGVTAGALVRGGLVRYVVGPVTGRRYLRATDKGRRRADLYRPLDGAR